MFRRGGYSLSAFFVRDLLDALRSRRLLAVSLALGGILLVSAWYLSTLALAAPGGTLLWQQGADGVLTTLAYAIAPLVLPLLPVSLVGTTLRRDRSRGDPDLAISRPAPGAGTALGKSAALFVAVAVPLVPLSVATAVTIQIMTNASFDSRLLLGFVVSNLILAALYLLLALPAGTVFRPRNLFAVMVLVWIGFNVLSPTAFLILGEVIGFRPVTGPQSFEPVWADALSFTGIYHGFLTHFVPGELGFVVFVESVIRLLGWAPLIWAVALLVLYSFVLGRVSR